MAGHSDKQTRYSGWSGLAAHPDSPSGGAGPGHSTARQVFGLDPFDHGSGQPHPNAPVSRTNSSQSSQSSHDQQLDIVFGPGSNPAATNDYTLGVLERILEQAGETRVTIVSAKMSKQLGVLELDPPCIRR